MLVADPARVLATTGVSWVGPDDSAVVRPYDPAPMDSPDRLARFEHMLRMLNEDAAIDPLASLVRREPVARIPRRNMMREDQVFATQLALAGRWGHVPEVLLSRRWKHETRPDLARYLDVPAWQGRFTTTFQTTQLMRVVSEADFPPLPRSAGRRGRDRPPRRLAPSAHRERDQAAVGMMTVMAFPGHAGCRQPLTRWRSLARTQPMVHQ